MLRLCYSIGGTIFAFWKVTVVIELCSFFLLFVFWFEIRRDKKLSQHHKSNNEWWNTVVWELKDHFVVGMTLMIIKIICFTLSFIFVFHSKYLWIILFLFWFFFFIIISSVDEESETWVKLRATTFINRFMPCTLWIASNFECRNTEERERHIHDFHKQRHGTKWNT